MFKVNNKDTTTTPGMFIVNFKHISYLVLVFLLLTLNMELQTGLAASSYKVTDNV